MTKPAAQNTQQHEAHKDINKTRVHHGYTTLRPNKAKLKNTKPRIELENGFNVTLWNSINF